MVFWAVIFIVFILRNAQAESLTVEIFLKGIGLATVNLMNYIGLGECSKRRETKRIVDRLDILAKDSFSRLPDEDVEKYKKIVEDEHKWD